MKTVNFKHLEIKNITGKNIKPEDLTGICEILGNSIFNYAFDISVNSLGPKIYHQEEVELNEKQITGIKEILNNRKMCGLSGFVVIALNKIFEGLLKA